MDLIAIVEEEAETAIAEAYAEGFKAGKKEEAGNAAYWESVAYRYREQAKKPPWIIPAWAASILITFIGGTATGIAVAR